MNARAGTVIVHVPYKGIAPATLDLLSGQIQAMTGTVSATLPYIADGKVRALAVTGNRRAPLLPDVPSWQEEGVRERRRRQLLGNRRACGHAARDRRRSSTPP